MNIKQYVNNDAVREALYKRTLKIVVFSQIFGGAGLAAGITVGALLAQDMLQVDGFAGLPAALFTLGSALSAYLVGKLSQRHGRRIGLSYGFFAGFIGATGVVLAATLGHVIFLFISLFIYGAGTSTNLQARYAGSDLASKKQRGMSVSIALVSTTLGAVLGPNLVTPMGKVAEFIGVPALAGPFILAAAAYLLAGLVLFIYLRPDPLLVAQEMALYVAESKETDPTAVVAQEKVNRAGIFVGATILILTHFIMVAVMTMTPVHMQTHGSGLTAVGIVIGLHIAAMYLPSLGTGLLVDKVGRVFMVVASALTLAISGVMAAFVPGDATVLLTIALVLLGLGWNFGLISGTAIIIDSTTIHTRAKTQGAIDVWVAIGGTAGSLLSGVIVAYSSYSMLGMIGTYLALILIPLMIWSHYRAKNKVATL